MPSYRIYKIENTVNNLLYVGYTTASLRSRMMLHKSAGRPPLSQSCENNPLYIAMSDIGVDEFFISLLEEGYYEQHDLGIALGREREWIEQLNTVYPNGYNKFVLRFTDANAAIIRFNAYKLSVVEYAALFGCSQFSIRSVQSSQIGRMYRHITKEHLPTNIEAYSQESGHTKMLVEFRKAAYSTQRRPKKKEQD